MGASLASLGGQDLLVGMEECAGSKGMRPRILEKTARPAMNRRKWAHTKNETEKMEEKEEEGREGEVMEEEQRQEEEEEEKEEEEEEERSKICRHTLNRLAGRLNLENELPPLKHPTARPSAHPRPPSRHSRAI